MSRVHKFFKRDPEHKKFLKIHLKLSKTEKKCIFSLKMRKAAFKIRAWHVSVNNTMPTKYSKSFLLNTLILIIDSQLS